MKNSVKRLELIRGNFHVDLKKFELKSLTQFFIENMRI